MTDDRTRDCCVWVYRYVLSVCNGEIEEGLEGVRRCLVRV